MAALSASSVGLFCVNEIEVVPKDFFNTGSLQYSPPLPSYWDCGSLCRCQHLFAHFQTSNCSLNNPSGCTSVFLCESFLCKVSLKLRPKIFNFLSLQFSLTVSGSPSSVFSSLFTSLL